jgi:dipeptidase E
MRIFPYARAMPGPQIVGFGGHVVGSPEYRALENWLLALTGKERPRVLFVPTASAESRDYVVQCFDAFKDRAELSHLDFFPWPPAELRDFVLGHDLIYAGGGNTANMLAIWREHGMDEIVREAWQAGVVLSGVSAGMICWFEGGVTDSFGPQLEGMECLGLIPGSACPHYDGEEKRRPRFHELVAGGFPGGWAADDGVALHFEGWELAEAVTAIPGKAAYRVAPGDDGVVEERVEARPI